MEYIPLKSTPSSYKNNESVARNAWKKQKKVLASPRSGYVGCDAKLIPRIKQYLQTCKQGKGINIANMVDILQQTYSEYRRKKRNAFKIAVIKAYDSICQEKAFHEHGSSTKESDSDISEFDGEEVNLGSDFSMDNDNYVIFEDANSANNSLRDLYSKKPMNTPSKNENAITSAVPSTPSTSVSVEGPSKAVRTPKDMEPIIISKTSLEENVDNIKNMEAGSKTPAKSYTPGIRKRKSITETDTATSKKGKPSKEIVLTQSTSTFADVGGNEKCIQEVCKLLVHLKHPEVYTQLGVPPPRGLLLHGPPGCGKTLLAHAIAGELDLPFIKMAATEIVSGVSGESEEKIRDLFEKAVTAAPCVLFLDEIDSITPKRETAQREMERRIVAQLLTCLDDLNGKDISTQVLVIGATNRPDALDPALRRAGRFDREISMGIPDMAARSRILKVLCRNLKLGSEFSFSYIAANTPGYVGADLMALTREAAMCAVNRVFHSLQKELVNDNDKTILDAPADEEMIPCIPGQDKLGEDTSPVPSYNSVLTWLHDTPPLTEEQLKNLFIEMSDFQLALKVVQPSAMREGFATVPDVTWSDVGALHEVREELQLCIMAPIRHPDKFKALGLTTPAGILLCGPPGCGKTLLAKAIANESGVNFISVKGPELLNMYVGESERAVRQCFQRARNSAPCVIFFDELDALCPKRSDSMEGSASARVVNQLLTEMDGVEKRRNVFILGASNRPDIIDPAIMRPGRLDKLLFVGLPTPEERVEILNTLTKNGTRPCLGSDISLSEIGLDSRCKGFTGADLAGLVREASVVALKEFMAIRKVCPTCPIVVKKKHFQDAYHRVRLSVSAKELLRYERMKAMFSNCGSMPTKAVVSMDIGEPLSTEIMDTTEPDVS